jgi:hypothetical protein
MLSEHCLTTKALAASSVRLFDYVFMTLPVRCPSPDPSIEFVIVVQHAILAKIDDPGAYRTERIITAKQLG